MSNIRKKWLTNSAANLISGLSAAVFNILLPGIVSRKLSADDFALWSLVVQVIVYINLFSLGLQTAMARAIAHSHDSTGHESSRAAVRAGLSIAAYGLMFAAAAVFLLAWLYPYFFPKIQPVQLGNFRWAIMLVGLSTAFQIMAQIPMGVFQGMHKNFYFVSVQVLVRIGTIVAVLIGLTFSTDLVFLAAIVALCSLMLWPLTWLVFTRFVEWGQEIWKVAIDKERRADLLKYCGTLSVWSVSMLLVNSAGILVVGRIDFGMTGPYSLALSASMVLAGLLNAALAPLMTMAAGLYSRPETVARIPGLLEKSTILASISLQFLLVLAYLLHQHVIALWVGEKMIEAVRIPLMILVMAQCIRNIAAPYALMLLATGLHQKALLTAVGEGVCTVMASVVLGYQFGAIGVAWGAVVGALVGVAGSLFVNIHNTHELTPRPLLFVLKCIVAPVAGFLPVYSAIYFL